MPARATASLRLVLPGLGLCGATALLAWALGRGEILLWGEAPLEPIVLAILLGAALGAILRPGARFRHGVVFSAKTLLEVAIVLLGASVSAHAVAAAGPGLLAGIAFVVVLAIVAGYGIGRVLGLTPRMAALVACGNAICGNSAIAATAPAIGADGDDVAASISYTALLGIAVVLALPLLVPLLNLSLAQYGVFAGLTVYAVPQVIAATAPVGPLSVQIGTLVKLERVLMLGPVVLCLALVSGRAAGGRPALRHMVPWFVVGFLALAALRSLGAIPEAALAPLATASTALTVVSMAALGLSVDLASLARAGRAVTAAALLSLLILAALSLMLIRVLGIL